MNVTIRQLQQSLELEKSDVRQLRSLCASLESDLVSSLDYATAAQVMLASDVLCWLWSDCNCRHSGSVFKERCLSSSSSSSIAHSEAILFLFFQALQQ